MSLIEKWDQLSCQVYEENTFHMLLGNTLTFNPSANMHTSNMLKDHVFEANTFVQRCSFQENLLWSAIKEIVIEVPGAALDEIDSTFVNLPSVQPANVTAWNFARSSLDASYTLLHVCDERKLDGDIRHLLKRSLFVDNLLKSPKDYHMYTIVVSGTTEHLVIKTIDDLKSRLRKAKEIEFEAMMSDVFFVRNFVSDQSVMQRTSVDIFTLVGADGRKEISNFLEAFEKHLCHRQRTVSLECVKLESDVKIICDNLEHALGLLNVAAENRNECHKYFNHQILTTLAFIRSQKDICVVKYNPNLFSQRLRDTLFSYFETQSGQLLEKFNHKILNNALLEDSQIVSVEHGIALQRDSQEISDHKRKRQKSACYLKFDERDAFRLLSSYVYVASQREPLYCIFSDLKRLSRVISNKFRRDLVNRLCLAGLHRYSKTLLRTSIWCYARNCEQSFDVLVTHEWIQNILGKYAIHSFHEALNDELSLTRSESLSKTVHRLLDVVDNDILVIFTSRFRSIQYTYHLDIDHLLGISNVVSSLHEITACGRLNMSLDFPLYHRDVGKSCITWQVVSPNAASNPAQTTTFGDIRSQALDSSWDNHMKYDFTKSKLGVPNATHHLNRIVVEALEFIERESLRRNDFFRIWGSDLLATFYFFREISNGLIQETAGAILSRFAALWLTQNAGIEEIYSIEDFLFYNEGYYVLRRLGFNHSGLRDLIRQGASKWNTTLIDYLGLRVKHTLPQVSNKFDDLSTAMVWSFFLSGNDLGIPGTDAIAVDSLLASRGALFLPVRSLSLHFVVI